MNLGPFELGKVHAGDCLAALQQLPSESCDAMVTDPPYCSGANPAQDTEAKYVNGGKFQAGVATGGRNPHPSFGGDQRMPHAFRYWCHLWLAECHRILKPGGLAGTFTDWRMLPEACDALEGGGFVRRGIVAWDKVTTKPIPPCYFRHQCEFMPWGTKGDVEKHPLGPWDGCIRVPLNRADKLHMTGKPIELMRQVLLPVRRGGIVLDPFAGSGSTGMACKLLGLEFLGFEQSPEYTKIANERFAT